LKLEFNILSVAPTLELELLASGAFADAVLLLLGVDI
jgi:hypothetical protein